MGTATAAMAALATLDQPAVRWQTLVIVAISLLLSVTAGPTGGLVVGVGAAACFIALHAHAGLWTGHGVALPLLLVLGLIAQGWITGLVGAHTRSADRRAARPPAAPGAQGSLGLLDEATGRALLAHEVERAQAHSRSVGVAMVKCSLDDLEPAAAERARRAAARTVEASAGPFEVPFAVGDSEWAVIVPEADVTRIVDRAEELGRSLGVASFADRAGDERIALAAVSTVETGMASLDGRPVDADALLAQARSSYGQIVLELIRLTMVSGV
ncbi:hypothetical protein ACQP1U_08225 [Actinomycetota bacterium]